MSYESLSDEEKLRVAAQVDHFMTVLLNRYGLQQQDVPKILDSLRWLQEHKAFIERIKSGGALSLVSILIMALASAVWQGVKAFLVGDK